MCAAVPAYFPPGAVWDTALAQGRAPQRMVVNPASGVGAQRDADYVHTVAVAQRAGVQVLGYVATGYAQRERREVAREVRRYRRWYGVDGVFFDEASSDAADLRYYRRLARLVRRRGGSVVLNPGTHPDERYLRVADVLVTFEGPFSAYRTATRPPWVERHDAHRFWHLVYDTPAEHLALVLDLAVERRAGSVYVTDDVLVNPWDTLPSFWTAHTSSVGGAATGTCAATRRLAPLARQPQPESS